MKNLIKVAALALVISSFAACDPPKKEEKTVIDSTNVYPGKLILLRWIPLKLILLKNNFYTFYS
ncbi:MAG: hypothetical protein ABI367_07560 [Mucilaginibacter sp.]